MSTPLKPSLATVHPRLPRPRARRNVQCPRCDHRFVISRMALSVRCPKCTTPMRFEDLTLKTNVHRDVNTMGVVNVTVESQLVGNIVCGQFTIEGRYTGKARVYGRILLVPGCQTRGELVGQSLTILHGACYRGKAIIGPKFRTLSPPEMIRAQTRKLAGRTRVLTTRRAG